MLVVLFQFLSQSNKFINKEDQQLPNNNVYFSILPSCVVPIPVGCSV